MKTSHSPLNLLKRPFKQRPQIKQSSTVRPLSALCLYSLGFFLYSLNNITSQVSQAHLEPVWLICFYTFTEGARRGGSRAIHPIPIGQTEIHDIKLRQPFPADAANHVFEVTRVVNSPGTKKKLV